MIKTVFRTFIITSIVLLAALGMIAADANSAYTGYGETNFEMPSYDEDTGEISGRVFGKNYKIEFLSRESLDMAESAVKRMLPFG
ncbi:MAG: hypothetical protein IKS19_06690 [Clostridia bacterium]|nr:hypothetical protein [Clostridia bacterium]